MFFYNASANETLVFGSVRAHLNKSLEETLRSNQAYCPNWDSSHHYLFQIANSLLFISYLAPHGLKGLLYLRSFLMLGSLVYAIWSWIIKCSWDMFLWNSVFTVLNFIHITVLLYLLRPVKFSHKIERVYLEIFKPLNVTRRDFNKIYSCRSEILKLKPNDVYCKEKQTQVERLALVLSGRFAVSQNNQTLHVVDSLQFLDSPEWFGVCTADCYQVTITALEENSQLLVWNRDKLKLTVLEDRYLSTVLDNLLGRDVVRKLTLAVSEQPAQQQDRGETALLLPKAPLGQSGMDVLLSRHVPSNCHHFNIWNLSRQVRESSSQKNVSFV